MFEEEASVPAVRPFRVPPNKKKHISEKKSKKKKRNEVAKQRRRLEFDFVYDSSKETLKDQHKKKLTTLRIDSSTKEIPIGEFSNCRNLQRVQLPLTLARIQKDAFRKCPNLLWFQFVSNIVSHGPTSSIDSRTQRGFLVFPEAMQQIDEYAFSQCPMLRKVRFCRNSTKLGKGAFSDCFGLISVELPKALRVIEPELLMNCQNCKSVKMPSCPLTKIGAEAFSNCLILFNIGKLREGLEVVGVRAFYKCRRLQSVEIPSSVIQIGEAAFSGCSGLISIGKLPMGLQIIPAELFKNCESLKTVEIPSSVTTIGEAVFSGCSSLISFGKLPMSLQVIPSELFHDCKSLEVVEIPSSVVEICQKAFDGCISLRSVNLPHGLLVIGDRSIAGCHSIDTLHIPTTVSSIGKGAFSSCIRLEYIKLPPSVESFEDSMFSFCQALKRVEILETASIAPSLQDGLLVIPEGATIQIGSDVFAHYRGLEEVIICSASARLVEAAFRNCIGLKLVELPEGLQVIEPLVFSECKSLTTVKISSSVTTIRREAFARCTGLTQVIFAHDGHHDTGLQDRSLVIPEGLQLEGFAFSECNRLLKVVICSASTQLGEGAFHKCSALQSVELPAGLQITKPLVFSRCKSLTTIKVSSSATTPIRDEAAAIPTTKLGEATFHYCTAMQSVELPEGLEVIEPLVFSRCESLTTVKISSSVTTILHKAFARCERLTHVEFAHHGHLTTLGRSAFWGCCSIETLRIPPSVISINDDTFRSCSGLKYIELSPTLKRIGSGAFLGCESLEYIKIPPSVVFLGDHVFQKCCSLSHIRLPPNIDTKNCRVTLSSFSGCRDLLSIELPEGFEFSPRGMDGRQHCELMAMCPSIVNLAIPALNKSVRSFVKTIKLMDVLVDGNPLDLLCHMLKHRLENCPLNKLCYYQSYYSAEDAMEQLRRLMEQQDATSQVDAFGLTPLHYLSLSQTPNLDMLLAVMKGGGGSSSSNLDQFFLCRDVFGCTPMDYLRLNKLPEASMVMQKVVQARLDVLGVDQLLKQEMMQIFNEEVLADWSSSSSPSRTTSAAALGRFLFKLAIYERKEILSLIEQYLWKMKIDDVVLVFCSDDDDDEKEAATTAAAADIRESCRINCGAAIVIPRILLFLDQIMDMESYVDAVSNSCPFGNGRVTVPLRRQKEGAEEEEVQPSPAVTFPSSYFRPAP
eukprot:scaffold609_cov130-Cylindrotheca_fusiformis.AAC.19